MASSPLAALQHRDFRLFWTGQLVSLIGTWMQVMALGYVLTGLSTEAWVLGAFNVVGSLPMLLLSARASELSDRVDKRALLMWTQAGMMLLAFAFAALLMLGMLTLWEVFLLGLLASFVEAFEYPAAQGLAPELVAAGEIPSAVALMQTILHVGRLVGPALAGWLIQHLGEASAFVANGVTFVAIMAALLMMKRPTLVAEGRVAPQPHFRDGWRYVRSDPATFRLLLLLLLAMILVFPFMVLLPYFSRHVLHVDAEGLGTMLSASGVGSLLGSLVLLRADPTAWRGHLVATVVFLAVSLGMMAWAPSLGAALAGSIAFCFSLALFLGTVNQTVQGRVPGDLRGRVASLFGMAFTGVLPLSALVLSALADLVGIRLLMAACAVLFLMASAAGALVLRLQDRRPAHG